MMVDSYMVDSYILKNILQGSKCSRMSETDSTFSFVFPVPQLMYDPAAAENKHVSGHVANGTIPVDHQSESPSLIHTVAEVHPDPAVSVNNGTIHHESDSEDEKEDEPLLKRKRPGSRSVQGSPGPQ